TTEYTKLWGEWVDLSGTLQQSLPPADLSDESLMAVYHALEKTGAIQPGLSIDQVRQAFGEAGFVRTATALSSALQEQAEKSDVRVNPRFGVTGVPSLVNTGQSFVFYSLPYVDQDGPVTDISTPEAPASGSPAPGAA
ncbi:hypothetical protein ACFWDZ_29830, partial [Micromonospora aurantiaca]